MCAPAGDHTQTHTPYFPCARAQSIFFLCAYETKNHRSHSATAVIQWEFVCVCCESACMRMSRTHTHTHTNIYIPPPFHSQIINYAFRCVRGGWTAVGVVGVALLVAAAAAAATFHVTYSSRRTAAVLPFRLLRGHAVTVVAAVPASLCRPDEIWAGRSREYTSGTSTFSLTCARAHVRVRHPCTCYDD